MTSPAVREHRRHIQERRAAVGPPMRRPVGKPEGAWIGDLTDLKKSLVLCFRCKAKFQGSAIQKHYYMDTRYPYVQGECDGCRELGRGNLFIHDEYVKDVWCV